MCVYYLIMPGLNGNEMAPLEGLVNWKGHINAAQTHIMLITQAEFLTIEFAQSIFTHIFFTFLWAAAYLYF